MSWPNRNELIYSLKCFAAAMLALYIALRIGLARPFWSMLTAYVVAHPLSGPVRSKAVYRVAGTFVGSSMTIVMVPLLANAPEILSLALALWVAGCLYVSLLDRTPRAYAFMLAGYTAALIGFPAVIDPATIFDVALARVEEIMLGILCATVIHSLFFPRSLGPVLARRLERAVIDARKWMQDALRGASQDGESRDRGKLAADITELRLLSTHLPFDTSHLRWTSSAIGQLHDRLSALVPLLSGVEDRVRELRKIHPESLSGPWSAALEQVEQWALQDASDLASDASRAAELRDTILALAPPVNADTTWEEAMKINLAVRLVGLTYAWQECRQLRHEIEAGLKGHPVATKEERIRLSPSVLHRDRGMALLSAAAAAIAIMACCAFWIVTAWPLGYAAAMMAAVFCSLFATQDDPVPGMKLFMQFTLWSIPMSALYLLVILPAVHNFESLLLVLAPLYIVLGVLIARPSTGGKAMAFLFGVSGTLSMMDTGTADLASFLNFTIGQLAGIGAAMLFTRLLRTVSAEHTARRLLRAGWRELAGLARSARPPSVTEVSARMLDRIALLTPRLAMAPVHENLVAVDALRDLRVGLNMTQLITSPEEIRRRLPILHVLLNSLSEHFRTMPDRPAAAEPGLLDKLDEALQETCALAQRDMVAALVGIRRDLFPDARPYQMASAVEKGL
ncbi:putative membrane protein YccC [Paucimonas lemoignei]|uniref:Putative membrane protein YccC n=1 Tax=Paucimonas lemoignei TaxID=29443 RepID=A0A4R3I1E5_PAULE|nr:FUSC family protein [Paucimonas lemoignei]TCS39352.1 putative membrane protein YccC [Paucimonas lemoignei]